MMKAKKQRIALVLPEELAIWVNSKVNPNNHKSSRTEVICRILDNARRKETVGTEKRKLRPSNKNASQKMPSSIQKATQSMPDYEWAEIEIHKPKRGRKRG